MTPLTLKLKGFIGIRAGLGRDEIELDLTTVDGELVALKGPNGTGKSTILDNLHPYRIMPSRAGSYSTGSFSYFDQTYGDAEKVLIWEHGEERYRSTLLIKGGVKTKKMECFLHVSLGWIGIGEDEAWGPVAIPDGTSSDGKASTYDACVEHILGSPEMYFTAAFSAQSRPSLSTYTTSEIKGLMSELLGTDSIRVLGEKARDVVKLLTGRRDGVRAQVAKVNELLAQHEYAQTGLDAAQEDAEAAAVLRATKRNELATATQALAEARASQNLQTDLEERRQALTNSLREAQTKSDARCREIQQDIQREQFAADQRKQAFDDTRQALQQRRAGIQARIATAETTLARRAEIEAAGTEVERLRKAQADLDAEILGLRTTAGQYRELRIERDNIGNEFTTAVTKGNNLKAYIDKLLAQAELADRVPCTGTDLQPKCELLASTLEAKAEVPAKQSELDAARESCEQLKTRRAELVAQVEALASAEQELSDAEAKQRGYYQQIAAAQRLADQVPLLAQAEQDLATARTELETLDGELQSNEALYQRSEQVNQTHIDELRERHKTAQQDGAAEAERIQAQLSELPPPGDRTALLAAESRVTRATESLDVSERELEQCNARIAQHNASIAALDDQLSDLTLVRTQLANLDAEIAHWQLLAKALGNDGIIALTIDDAGPTLASLANQLLLACYGPRFTVSIQTQAETAKGDAKETFDIRVFDGDRDDEKSVRDMSGGEKIWVNECLTRAIALYQAQQTGQQFGTLFADESDGALDLDRKIQFMAMKREVLRLGGYRRELFISHTPDLWDLADAVIDIGALKVAA